MTERPIVPVADLANRIQEHGRIRFGVKTANAMKVIDTFRFTSPDEEAIHQIAALYGGRATQWNDPKANPPRQFQVITTATEIRVFIVPHGLTTWYEQWSGGGLLRRCDGVSCELVQGDETKIVDCLCAAKGQRVCRPKTRLNVILPEVRLGGVWRLETGSWNAAREMPSMEAVLDQLHTSGAGVVEALLCLVKQSKVEKGRKRNYIIPRIQLSHSANQILGGEAVPHRPAIAAPEQLPPQLPAATPDKAPARPALGFDLDDVIDAEVIDFPTEEGKGLNRITTRLVLTVKQAAERHGVDEDVLRHALARKASKGRTASSRDLQSAEQSQVIEWATALADGDFVIKFMDDGPPKVVFERP